MQAGCHLIDGHEETTYGNIWFCLVAIMIAMYVVLDGLIWARGSSTCLSHKPMRKDAPGAALHRPGLGRQ